MAVAELKPWVSLEEKPWIPNVQPPELTGKDRFTVNRPHAFSEEELADEPHLEKFVFSHTQIRKPAENHTVFKNEQAMYDDFGNEAVRVENGEMLTEAMVSFPDGAGNEVADIFKATDPKVKKRYIFDSYNWLAMKNSVTLAAVGNILNPVAVVNQVKALWDFNKLKNRFRESGAQIEELNKPFGKNIIKWALPYLGTDHTKAKFIRNSDHNTVKTYVPTANDESEPRINAGIKFIGEEGRKLAEEKERMLENPKDSRYDQPIQLSENTYLLVDKGEKGKSLIYDTAIEAVKNAHSQVQVMTIMHPDGKFADALNETYKRFGGKNMQGKTFDVMSTEYDPFFETNLPDLIQSIKRKLNDTDAELALLDDIQSYLFDVSLPGMSVSGTFKVVDELARRKGKKKGHEYEVMYDNNRWPHAKTLLFDKKVEPYHLKVDGKYQYDSNGQPIMRNTVQGVMIGSHNYAQSGVDAGTVEWQILTYEPKIVQGIKSMFEDYKHIVAATASETSLQSQLF